MKHKYLVMVTWKNEIEVIANSKEQAIDIAREEIDGFPDIDNIEIISKYKVV